MREVLVFLMFFAPTVQYRASLGPFSVALMEPFVLLASAGLLIHEWTKRRLQLRSEPIVLLLAGIAVWAAVIWPLGPHWKQGLSDLRNWVIPIFALFALRSSRDVQWRRWVGLFIAAALVAAGVGMYQHLTDSFRPFATTLSYYKTGFSTSPDDSQLLRASFAVGFFDHPNGLAMYLLMALMATIGWLVSGRDRRLLKLVAVVPLGLALWWTFAKTSVIIAVLAVSIFGLERRLRDGRTLAITVLGLGAAMASAFWAGLHYLPSSLFATLWWRIGLWNTAVEVIRHSPRILAFGNGMDLFASSAYYPQPHDLFVYTLLQYGIPGLALVSGILFLIWHSGWSTRRRLGDRIPDPLQSALWIALLGYFAIGLLESSWLSIEQRMIFITVLACYLGLRSEMAHAAGDSAGQQTVHGVAQTPDERTNGSIGIEAAAARPDHL